MNKDGLSPPTRGSRPEGGIHPEPVRSIPAHAGEPTTLPGPKRQPRVYPRPRGGAECGRFTRCDYQGLSPPTRGSHTGTLDDPSTTLGLSPPTRGSLLPRHANMTYLLRFGPDYIKICQKTQVSASGGARRTRRTPSASQISFGGSPKWRRASLPDSATSRWIITTPPFPSVSNHRDTTAQMRSRTPLDISGATYTPGATSSIAEARNPR